MQREKVSVSLFLVVILTSLIFMLPTALYAGPETKPDDSMTLAALGDCLIGRKISLNKDPGFLKLVNLIRQADCTWTNLEVPLVDTDRADVYPAPFLFALILACKPWGARELQWLGVDFVGLANNHAMDFGYTGLFSTIENLKRVGIGYAGGGKDLEEASKPPRDLKSLCVNPGLWTTDQDLPFFIFFYFQGFNVHYEKLSANYIYIALYYESIVTDYDILVSDYDIIVPDYEMFVAGEANLSFYYDGIVTDDDFNVFDYHHIIAVTIKP